MVYNPTQQLYVVYNPIQQQPRGLQPLLAAVRGLQPLLAAVRGLQPQPAAVRGLQPLVAAVRGLQPQPAAVRGLQPLLAGRGGDPGGEEEAEKKDCARLGVFHGWNTPPLATVQPVVSSHATCLYTRILCNILKYITSHCTTVSLAA